MAARSACFRALARWADMVAGRQANRLWRERVSLPAVSSLRHSHFPSRYSDLVHHPSFRRSLERRLVAGRPLLGRPHPRRREADALRLPNAEVDAAGRRLHRRQPCLVARWSLPLLPEALCRPSGDHAPARAGRETAARGGPERPGPATGELHTVEQPRSRRHSVADSPRLQRRDLRLRPQAAAMMGGTRYGIIHRVAPGDQEPSDNSLPISQWCPNGSTIRPKRQPYWLPTGQTTVAPAATARSKAASGSSTVITIRTEPPPRDSGLKNSASPTDSRATTSPPSLSIRNNSPAPNAAL